MSDKSAGLLIVDKPAGLTSHDVVNRARRLCGTRRVGHAGTLDPMATGVLVLGVNRATKLLTFLTGVDKQYRATVRLGASTTTDDAEGEFLMKEGCPSLNREQLSMTLQSLRGEIMQVPSSVSAIKVNGQRAYKRVRSGEEVKLKARPIRVDRFELVGSPRQVDGFVDLDVIVDCSSGTYIRALARDLGETLGVGGHLVALRRTRVGEWGIEQASPLEEAELLPLGEACLDMYPALQVSQSQAEAFRHGQVPDINGNFSTGNFVLTCGGEEPALEDASTRSGNDLYPPNGADKKVIGLVTAVPTKSGTGTKLKTALVIDPI